MKLLEAFEIINNLPDHKLKAFREDYKERLATMIHDGGMDDSIETMIEAFKCVFRHYAGDK